LNDGHPLAGHDAVLRLEHVFAAYGPYRALFDVSFTVPEGGVLALIGSNGAGKSTVARTVSGLVTATGGQVVFRGHDITRLAPYRIARLGVAHVVEGRGVFASLSVEENLRLAFEQRDRVGMPAEDVTRALEAFPILGQRRRQPAGTLSGGEQRLLSLAKVLIVPPVLLIADELSFGLAPVAVEQVYDGLRRINANGTALMIVEQQASRVLSLASRAVVLDHGRVAFEGPPEGAGAVVASLTSLLRPPARPPARPAAGGSCG
jgi:branched-chain amino acid transport system ATP-binding protein